MTNEANRNEDTVEPLVRPLARCDEKGHILVRIGGCECGITDIQAIDYVLQLSEAVMVSHRMPNASRARRKERTVKALVGHFDYVRRCKSARGEETHKTTHAARGSTTLCGKYLGGMWYVLSAWGRTPDEVDCRKCRRALMANSAICDKTHSEGGGK